LPHIPWHTGSVNISVSWSAVMVNTELDELIVRLIAGVDLFRHLDRQAIVDILRGASRAVFKAGEIVFEEGAEGHSLYVPVRGSFEVFRQQNGNRVQLAKISPGGHFGEIALLGARRRTASVKALENSLAIRFSRQSLDTQPAVASLLYRNMACMLAERLIKADEEIMFHHRTDARTTSAEPAPVITPPPRRIG
jgi:CRP-like cAMP-binding protein